MAEQAKSTLSVSMRPGNFEEVIGLADQIKSVRAKIAEGVPRGFLMAGPYGCGKTTLAYLIAREVQGWEHAGTEPQVLEINSADNRKIEDMRELADVANTYPMSGKYRVIILDECHQITKEGQQVLLKELERPTSPTVWILATTDPEKLNKGVRDRCFPVRVEGMDASQRLELIQRAAKELNHEGDLTEFVNAITKSQVVSPRKILMAFDAYHSGQTVARAVGSLTFADFPEFHEIAFALIFGQWDKDVTLPWAGNKKVRAAGVLLKELDERLKKKPKPDADAEEAEGQVDEEDLTSKTEAASALRAITAAFLKGQLLPTIAKAGEFKFKAPDKIQKAYAALHVLANGFPASAFEMQWPAALAALYRVNQILNGK